MALTSSRTVIDTNGTTPVTVVPSPGANQEVLIPPGGINIHNDSGGALDVILRFNDGSNQFIIKQNATLADGATMSNDGPIHLNVVTDLIEVLLGGAGTIPVVSSYLIKS